MYDFSPVVLFTFNRPNHTKRTIEALKKNIGADRTRLIVFSDAPGNETDTETVSQVRQYIGSISAPFTDVQIIMRDKNMGLANSVISGVTDTVDKFGKVIVLEDDMETSPFFLKYMNEALSLYENEEKVISIHAYLYPLKNMLSDTFFLMGADCWGWGTWKRGWKLFNPDANYLLQQLTEKGLIRRFDFEGAKPYSEMLKNQINGKVDSWAVRWYASALLAGKLTLYPGKSLVRNIGNDASGSHSISSKIYDVDLYPGKIEITDIPLAEDKDAYKQFRKYLLSIKPSFIRRCYRFFSRKLKRRSKTFM